MSINIRFLKLQKLNNCVINIGATAREPEKALYWFNSF